MKAQKINPNNMNPMEMNSINAMMGMMNSIQKIGKAKRKYSVMLDKNTKKFLGKFIDEIKKQFVEANNVSNVVEFFDYVKAMTNSKEQKELLLSFEEREFITKMLYEAVKNFGTVEFKWYQFIKKLVAKLMIRQYRELHAEFKK